MVPLFLVVLALGGLVAGDVSHLGYKYSKPTIVSAKVQLPIILPVPQSVIKTETKLSTAPLPLNPAPEIIPPGEIELKSAPITLPSKPAAEYIPPSEPKLISPSPVIVAEPLPELKQKEGYKYPAPKPVQPVQPVLVSEELSAPIEPEPAHELANDGYRYKTVRRIKYRHRV